jgi:hypothetical protein
MKNALSLFLLLGAILAMAQSSVPFRKGNKWGLCDESKRVILQSQYDSIGLFTQCGLAVVLQKGKFGFIDCMGNLVIPCRYTWVSGFTKEDKCITEVIEGETQYFVDTTGAKVEPEKPEKSKRNEHEILAADNPGSEISKNGKVGYTCAGAASVPPVYEAIAPCNYLLDRTVVLRAQLNGKAGIITCSNKIIIPFSYHFLQQSVCRVNGISTVYFVASQDDLFGLMNAAGKTIIPFKYASLELMEDGFSKVKTTDGKWGYVSLNGIEYFED